MPQFIFRVKDRRHNFYYGEWSTIVDAPVSYLLNLEDFIAYYQSEYGINGMRGLIERLERVVQNGTSAIYRKITIKELLNYNRAGTKESQIKTSQELIDCYKPE